ncbi:hypothetical protein [Persicobacter diffluens]
MKKNLNNPIIFTLFYLIYLLYLTVAVLISEHHYLSASLFFWPIIHLGSTLGAYCHDLWFRKSIDPKALNLLVKYLNRIPARAMTILAITLSIGCLVLWWFSKYLLGLLILITLPIAIRELVLYIPLTIQKPAQITKPQEQVS